MYGFISNIWLKNPYMQKIYFKKTLDNFKANGNLKNKGNHDNAIKGSIFYIKEGFSDKRRL